jgi:hypothetical protein
MELVRIDLVSIILFLFIFKKHELAGGIWDVKNSNHGLSLVKLMENHHYFEKKKLMQKLIDVYNKINSIITPRNISLNFKFVF